MHIFHRISALGHPLQSWPRSHRRAALVCVVLAALLPTVLGAIVKPLHEGEPGGESIIDFELAGSVERTEEILATWRAEGVLDEAKAIQVLDLFYPLVYAAALAGGCIAASGAWQRAGRPRLAAAGIVMAWVAFAAAGFDYVENLGLGISLWGDPASPWPQVALVAALLKFAAIYSALLYALSGVVAALLARGRRKRAGPLTAGG
jgi:hypothetical protein